MFEKMVKGWFDEDTSFGDFVSAMFAGEEDEMNYGFAFEGEKCLIRKG
ncbi:MAG: hypothetical protein IJ679_02430 [Lachnospiraceae bacterium]|nr:hypothetical protein [Lachnospiraceae bacterium]